MWKIPSQTVTVKDPLVLEVVSPEMLKSQLNLHYLHRDVATILNPSLIQCLGIECLNTEHLLLIGKSLPMSWEKEEHIDRRKYEFFSRCSAPKPQEWSRYSNPSVHGSLSASVHHTLTKFEILFFL